MASWRGVLGVLEGTARGAKELGLTVCFGMGAWTGQGTVSALLTEALFTEDRSEALGRGWIRWEAGAWHDLGGGLAPCAPPLPAELTLSEPQQRWIRPS